MNEIFTRNITKKITLPSKWAQNESQNYLTGLVKLCIHGCKKCVTIKPFIRYPEISTEYRKRELSKIILPFCLE